MVVLGGRPQEMAGAYADRDVATPGQLATYYIGYEAIRSYRESAERALGSRFDSPQFHREVLKDGTVTLASLGAKVDRWIAARRREPYVPGMAAPSKVALHHVALPVSDLERSRRFYTDVLGLRAVERPAAFDFPGAWFAIGDGQLHLIERVGGTLRTGKPLDSRDVHFAIRVADFEAMVEHLRSRGYRDNLGPTDAMWMRIKRRPNAGFPQIFVADPDSHVIEINTAA